MRIQVPEASVPGLFPTSNLCGHHNPKPALTQLQYSFLSHSGLHIYSRYSGPGPCKPIGTPSLSHDLVPWLPCSICSLCLVRLLPREWNKQGVLIGCCLFWSPLGWEIHLPPSLFTPLFLGALRGTSDSRYVLILPTLYNTVSVTW